MLTLLLLNWLIDEWRRRKRKRKGYEAGKLIEIAAFGIDWPLILIEKEEEGIVGRQT